MTQTSDHVKVTDLSKEPSIVQVDILNDQTTVAICRCGFSSNAPFCDASHEKNPGTPGPALVSYSKQENAD